MFLFSFSLRTHEEEYKYSRQRIQCGKGFLKEKGNEWLSSGNKHKNVRLLSINLNKASYEGGTWGRV